MNKKRGYLILIIGILFFFLIHNVSAALNVSLSDHGTNVKYKSNGTLINNGDLEVTIYDALTGGNLIYNETFTDVINNGSWNLMLGENESNPLQLEFGKIYYKDYKINGQDMNFTNFTGGIVDRRFFYSPLGDIGGEDISTAANLTVASLNLSGWVYLNGSHFDLGNNSNLFFDNINNQVSIRLQRFGVIHSLSNPNVIGIIQGRAPNTAGTVIPFAEMGLLATNTTSGVEDGEILFKTIKEGVFTEHMRITSNGGVGIGTSSPDAILEIETTTTKNNTILRLESTVADSYPSIRFVNDVREWRIYGPDGSQNDAFVIYDATVPVTRFAIDTDGNVGVGTGNPSAKLEIRTAGINDAVLQLKSTAANSYPHIKFVNDVREWRIYGADGSQGNAFVIHDGTVPATRFAIDTEGEVGIGIAYPNASLEIMRRGAAGYTLNVSGLIYANDTNVGIGTLTPSAKLEVVGSVKISDMLQLNVSIIPACDITYNGSIMRNGTGVYGCAANSTWIRLF